MLRHLPDRHAPRTAELTIGYRLPAARRWSSRRGCCDWRRPGSAHPRSIRATGDEPIVAPTTRRRLRRRLAAPVRLEQDAVGTGNVAVIVPAKLLAGVDEALAVGGIDFGRAQRGGLDHQVTVIPVSLVKGLELDACIVVEPQTILDSEHRGAQALYVALTRATKRLTVLHERPLPEALLSRD